MNKDSNKYKWINVYTNSLFTTIMKLRNLDEMRKFLRDLLTEPEIIEFSKRWQAAQMLAKKIPYTKIEKKAGLSSATVARVAKWLNNGMGGYKLALRILKKGR